jgi:hypothetical protein
LYHLEAKNVQDMEKSLDGLKPAPPEPAKK